MERPPPDRYDGFYPQHSATSLLFSAPRGSGSGMQCSSTGLVQVEPDLSLSPIMVNSKDCSKTSCLRGSGPHDPSLDASRTMVPGNSRTLQEMETLSRVWNPHYWVAQLRSLDRISFLKLALSHVHGEDIANHLAAAYRTSTVRQAQSVWKIFQTSLPREAMDITRDTVLRFLIHLASERKLNTRTVLNYRGALALPLRTAFRIDFSHESFNLLTRSLFLENPPKPKKIPSWSLDVVLEAFSSERFSLLQISPSDLFLK